MTFFKDNYKFDIAYVKPGEWQCKRDKLEKAKMYIRRRWKLPEPDENPLTDFIELACRKKKKREANS